jgi:hypothetical protein
MEPDAYIRFSRQIILPEVGYEGQRTWEKSTLLLAGSGTSFESCSTALMRSGVGRVLLWESGSSVPPETERADTWLTLTNDPKFQRKISRLARRRHKPALFGWTFTEGYALARFSHSEGCACLECFETFNPKVFRGGNGTWDRIAGAQTASEALLGLLKQSPLENAVWTTFDSGISKTHAVSPVSRCAARMEK